MYNFTFFYAIDLVYGFILLNTFATRVYFLGFKYLNGCGILIDNASSQTRIFWLNIIVSKLWANSSQICRDYRYIDPFFIYFEKYIRYCKITGIQSSPNINELIWIIWLLWHVFSESYECDNDVRMYGNLTLPKL